MIKSFVSHRRVILIGELNNYKDTLRQLTKVATCNRFYILNEEQCTNFLEEFPIFKAKNWENSRTVTNMLPIMVINTQELVGEYSPMKIYVHASNKIDKKIYRECGITGEGSLIH